MKLRIRAQVFLPVLLVLVLLPLTTYLVFNMTADQYMRDESEKELKGVLLAARPTADRIFREPDDLDTITPKQLALVEQAQARDFTNQIRPVLKNSGSGARVLVLNGQFEPIYPRELAAGSGDRLVYDYFRDEFAVRPEGPGRGEVEQVALDEQVYLVYSQEMEPKTAVRARYLVVYSPVYDTSALMDGVARLALAITASLAVISLAAMWVVAGSISRPIRRLCDHAKRIGRGDFHHIEERTLVREVSELTAAMNEMSEQLGRSDDAQKTFFQNASHELRTPLMSISGYAQGIQCGVFPDTAEAAGIIMSESARLTELVDGILTLSRMDNRRQALELRPVELYSFVGVCLKRLEGMAMGREVSLVFEEDGERELYARADGDLLVKTFYNVCSNCIRYATSQVHITISAAEGLAAVTVEDDGPGFAPEDVDHLFERFYKGKGGNFGIGLAIAKSSVEYMGGEISARNTGTGASFTLYLQLAEDAG